MKQKNQKYLSNYEAEMITAYFHQYIRNLPQSVLSKIEEIYIEESGNDTRHNLSCGNCTVDLLKQTARLYFTEYSDRLPDDLKSKFTPIKQQ